MPERNDKAEAVRKLREANELLAGLASDGYAPVYCLQVLDICEQRYRELRALWDRPLFQQGHGPK